MKVIKAYPPLWPRIAKRFPFIKGRQGILYAWGDRLFNPSGVTITPAIMAHEEVHGQRQLATDINDWWSRYLDEDAFRLDEEIRAHHAEWEALQVPDGGGNWITLNALATRLSSPLYGNMISKEAAEMEIIRGRK